MNLESIHDGVVSIALLALTFLLIGCAAPTADSNIVSEPQPSAIVPDAAALFVFVREFSFDHDFDDIKDEENVLACVQQAVNEEYRSQRIIAFDEFSRTAFIGVAPESVPRKPEYYTALLESTQFRQRTGSLGLRYIVFVGGVEKKADYSSFGGCGAQACVAYMQWERASYLGASVLDLKEPAPAEKLEAAASGTAWLAIAGIFPIGLPSMPTSVACDALGTQVARFLRDRQTAQGD